jgi:predicted regulator of Ras-like GTPase activity (Roadblock/LC7/MglB family)
MPNPAIRDGGRESPPAPGPAASAPAAEAPAAAPPAAVAPPAVVPPPQSASRLAPALPPVPAGADGGPWPEICEQFGLHLLVLAEQLRLSLDELEADEGDPERLEQLYRIDHGVTRMRRASRDLRVLAGRGEEALDGPVTSLLDVIRMAASAIDRYGQVQVGKAAELAVVGYAADDVGSLMAALLENATQYSPETVTVSAHLLGDGSVMFRIEDSGIGMSPEQVAALNEMLAGPVPDVDERTGRHTGFPVAHRIARQHMITVRLASRPAPRTGTLAMVTVPPHLLCEIPEDEAIHPAAPAARPAAAVGSRVTGPRGRAALAGLTARHVAPGAPGELPRRESASLRGDRPAPAAESARAGTDAGMGAADQAAARRAFAADLAAFAQASAALGDHDGTEGQGGGAASDSLPWDHGSGPADGRATQEGTVLQMTGTAPEPPRGPQDFGWLLDNFATSTPGVSHALIVSSDGLPLVAAAGMSADLADPLAAMTSGILALGNNIAGKVGEPRCEQMMLKFSGGHFLFMGIGSLAGFAVLVREGANLGVVAHQMAQLVDAAGHVLTPQLRDDLRRRMAASALGAGA